MQAIGLVVLFLGIAGALEKMFTVSGGTVASSGSMLAVVSLVLGAVTGEFLDIERRLEQFGDWLRVRLHSERDPMFVEGFVTTVSYTHLPHGRPVRPHRLSRTAGYTLYICCLLYTSQCGYCLKCVCQKKRYCIFSTIRILSPIGYHQTVRSQK